MMYRNPLRRGLLALATAVPLAFAAGAAQAGLYAMPSAAGQGGVLFFDDHDGAPVANGPFHIANAGSNWALQALEVGNEVWITQYAAGVYRYDRATGNLLPDIALANYGGGMAIVGDIVHIASRTGGSTPADRIMQFGFDASPQGFFLTPTQSSVMDVLDFQGGLLVAAAGGEDLVRYSYAGESLGTWYDSGIDNPGLRQIALAPNGDVWAAYGFAHSIVQLRGGELVASYSTGDLGPWGIAVLDNGEVLWSYVTGPQLHGEVYALDPATGTSRFITSAAGAYFQAVAVPEPATMLLWLPGLGLLFALRRRRG